MTIQDVLVGVLALAALVWLVRRRFVNKKSCDSCALAEAVRPKNRS